MVESEELVLDVDEDAKLEREELEALADAEAAAARGELEVHADAEASAAERAQLKRELKASDRADQRARRRIAERAARRTARLEKIATGELPLRPHDVVDANVDEPCLTTQPLPYPPGLDEKRARSRLNRRERQALQAAERDAREPDVDGRVESAPVRVDSEDV